VCGGVGVATYERDPEYGVCPEDDGGYDEEEPDEGECGVDVAPGFRGGHGAACV